MSKNKQHIHPKDLDKNPKFWYWFKHRQMTTNGFKIMKWGTFVFFATGVMTGIINNDQESWLSASWYSLWLMFVWIFYIFAGSYRSYHQDKKNGFRAWKSVIMRRIEEVGSWLN